MKPFFLGIMAVVLLLPAATPALAQSRRLVEPVVEARPDALVVTLTCPTSTDAPALAVDGAMAHPLVYETLGTTPVAIALVIDQSALQAGPGTPGHTLREDTLQIARASLAIAAPDAPLTLVAVAEQAEVVLPPAMERSAVEDAIDALAAPGSVTAEQPSDLAGAITLGVRHLDGPRAVLAITTATQGSAAMRDVARSEAPTLVVRVGHAAQGPEERVDDVDDGVSGPLWFSYTSEAIATLPALNRGLEARIRSLLATSERIRLTLPSVGPGPHLLAVSGCGAPLTVAFEGPLGLAGPGAAVGGAALALVLGVGLGAWGRGWRRSARRAKAQPATTAARLDAAAAITTARRVWTPTMQGGLRAVLWDVKGRRTVALEGRHWTIGGDPACTLCVEGEGIAPLHARLSATPEGLRITDLEGEGGVRLGLVERRLTPGVAVPLAEGELVLLGRSLRMMVERVSAEGGDEL